MGYSSRYHIASLTAVFVALAAGLLIGSELGGDVLDSTRKNLEQSLTEDLERNRAENDELRQELAWARDLGSAAVTSLVAERLTDQRYALVGFGSLPGSVVEPVEKVLGEAGADLAGIGIVREPPSVEALAARLEGTVFVPSEGPEVRLRAYGQEVGRQLILGGTVFRRTRAELMSSSSGSFGSLDGVVIYRGSLTAGSPDPVARRQSRVLFASMVDGMVSTGAVVVGVEQSDEENSFVPVFESQRIPSVDSVDLESGQLSLVYVLGGAQGKFGVKEEADTFLPTLARPLAAGND